MSVSLYGSGQTVIQVVQGSSSTQTSTTSTSFVATGLTATITPQSTTSKIFVMFNGILCPADGNGGALSIAIYRNGSNIFGDTANSGDGTMVGSDNPLNMSLRLSMNYLDSPSTTSATTYTLYLAASSGLGFSGSTTAYLNHNGASTSTLTLFEISGS
jgi:hypothetical protein